MEFKVGDWVNLVRVDGIIFDTFRYNNTVIIPKGYMLEHWEPKEGEWVWYFDRLVKIIEINEEGYIKAINPLQTEDYYFWVFNKCEPYIIDILPSFMENYYKKDNI